MDAVYSGFIYGHTITANNQWIDFTENGVTELSIQIDFGSYTLTEFVSKVIRAMNEIGTQVYTASLDRLTRKITISAAGNFDLLVSTGTHSSISAFELMGFNDKSGSNSYEADNPSGSFYEAQYPLQRYVDFENNVEISNSKVNESASGKVEVISYGTNKFMECNIKYATNITGQGVIKNNPNGENDLRAFLNYAILKRPMEFVRDVTLTNFNSCILESTSKSNVGTAFTLFELYAQGLANYFETKTLTFREL